VKGLLTKLYFVRPCYLSSTRQLCELGHVLIYLRCKGETPTITFRNRGIFQVYTIKWWESTYISSLALSSLELSTGAKNTLIIWARQKLYEQTGPSVREKSGCPLLFFYFPACHDRWLWATSNRKPNTVAWTVSALWSLLSDFSLILHVPSTSWAGSAHDCEAVASSSEGSRLLNSCRFGRVCLRCSHGTRVLSFGWLGQFMSFVLCWALGECPVLNGYSLGFHTSHCEEAGETSVGSE